MIGELRKRLLAGQWWIWGIAAAVLFGAAMSGPRASLSWLALPLLGIGTFVLIQKPILGLFGLVLVAPLGYFGVNTGTDVSLTPATLLIPVLIVLWVLDVLPRGGLRLVPSRTNRPLLLFLAASLLSLLIGLATWDPAVPRSSSFLMVQFAQWAIFALSAGAFWLAGNMIQNTTWLRRLVFTFLALAGALAILRVLPATEFALASTFTVDRAPFWALLAALAGGQLAFNRSLSTRWRIFLCLVVGACLVYALYWQRATAAYWVGVTAVIGVLAWLRWPRLRWPVVLLLVVLAAAGGLFSTVYEFAGGGDEWVESGGSRLALIGRVIEVTMRNPVTGLGPAAYRRYAAVEPLLYGRALWLAPSISSHNNYVDLFSHVGLLGLTLLFWFTVELARLGLRLRARFTQGFTAGYINGMIAAGAASLVLMMIADWILPFVYNIGFVGFQSSVLVWLFLGGLLALDAMSSGENPAEVRYAA